MHKILISSTIKELIEIDKFNEKNFIINYFENIDSILQNNFNIYDYLVINSALFLKYYKDLKNLNTIIVSQDNESELYEKGANLVLEQEKISDILPNFLENNNRVYEDNLSISLINNISNESNNLNSLYDHIEIITNNLSKTFKLNDISIILKNSEENYWYYLYKSDNNKEDIIEKIDNDNELVNLLNNTYKSETFNKAKLQSCVHLFPLSFNNEIFGFIKISCNKKINKAYLNQIEKSLNIISLILYKKKVKFIIKKSEEKIQEIEKFKSAFLSNLSHEIRTPMNSILGFSSLLNDEYTSDEEKTEYVELIHQNANNLMNLIMDMVEIAKIDSGEININKVETNINSIFKDSIEEINKFENIKSNIIIDGDISKNNLFLITDPYRFGQSLIKILHNAVKFGEGKDIHIGYFIDKSKKLNIYVKDQGIGIDKKNQKKIFESFNQLKKSDLEEYGGTGLGLSIVKGIMDKLGVEIKIESEIRKGSNFILVIDEKDYKKTNGNLKGIGNYFWNDKTILIIEDNLSNYQYLNAILQRSKANIIWEKDGYNGLIRFINEPKVDLVLMDILMPIMNGIDCTKEIRKLNTEVPIIAQTAYKGSENEKNAMDAGCNLFFTKPINAKALLAKIDNFFN